MRGRLLNASDIDAMLEDGTLKDLKWSDLERMEYDPAKERCALVVWRAECVDEHGEVFAGHWHIEMSGDVKRYYELHTWGVLLFGDPPWRRSQVISVFGRLGSVEAAVKALSAPGEDFVYAFSLDDETLKNGLSQAGKRAEVRVAGRSAVPPAGRFGGESTRQRAARWRRAAASGEADDARAAKPARIGPRQGELF